MSDIKMQSRSDGFLKIRTAVLGDAARLAQIYRPYVEKTAVTFEYEAPDEAEFRRRIAEVLEKYPYLVAESEEKILGYAYVGAFKDRAAYDWSVETSVYVDEGERGRGVGTALYRALEEICASQNIINMNACIAYPEVEDEYLTRDSVRFHEHMGYRLVGEFHKCGYKFGKWYNMVWMEKMIDGHPDTPAKIIPFGELPAEYRRMIL